jgi:hypothetical protein
MPRISIYVPQVPVPDLPGPEIKPVDATEGLFGAAKTILGAMYRRDQAAAAQQQQNASDDDADQDQPDQPPVDDQPPRSRKSGFASTQDPSAGAADAIGMKQKQDAGVYAANVLAKLAETGLNGARAAGIETGFGHTLTVNDEFQKSVNEIFANAPNELAKQLLVRGLPRVHAQVHQAAIAAEAAANVAKRYGDVTETLDTFGRLIAADPTQLPELLAHAKLLNESLILTPSERVNLERRLKQLPVIAPSSVISRDPNGAMVQMQRGEWARYLDPDTLKRMKSLAEQRITISQSNADAESEFNKEHLRLDLDNFGKTVVNGELTSGTNPLDMPERFTETLGKNIAKTAADTIDAQREIGTFFAAAQTMGRRAIDQQPNVVGSDREADNQHYDRYDDFVPREVLASQAISKSADLRNPTQPADKVFSQTAAVASPGPSQMQQQSVRAGRPPDNDTDRVIDELGRRQYGKGEDGNEPVAGWVVFGPNGMTFVPGDRHTDQAEAKRNPPPPGASIGYHGHPPSDASKFVERFKGGAQREADAFNEAQGYPGPGDLDEIRRTGKPEIVVAANRIILLYLDEQGRPVAEVLRGAPFPPNNEERINDNSRLHQYIERQGWRFINGPRAKAR